MKLATRIPVPERGRDSRDWIQIAYTWPDTSDLYCEDCHRDGMVAATEYEDCLNGENYDETCVCCQCGSMLVDLGEELGECWECRRPVFRDHDYHMDRPYVYHADCGRLPIIKRRNKNDGIQKGGNADGIS